MPTQALAQSGQPAKVAIKLKLGGTDGSKKRGKGRGLSDPKAIARGKSFARGGTR